MTAFILLGSTVAVCLIILVAACGLVIYFPSVLLLQKNPFNRHLNTQSFSLGRYKIND